MPLPGRKTNMLRSPSDIRDFLDPQAHSGIVDPMVLVGMGKPKPVKEPREQEQG